MIRAGRAWRWTLLAAALAACGGRDGNDVPAAAGGPGAFEMDRVLAGAAFILAVDGRYYGQVRADSMYVDEDSSTAKLFGVQLTMKDSLGNRIAELTSATAHYDLRSQVLSARGGVRLSGPGGERVESEELTLTPSQHQFSSAKPTRYVSPNGATSTYRTFAVDDRFRRPGAGGAAR